MKLQILDDDEWIFHVRSLSWSCDDSCIISLQNELGLGPHLEDRAWWKWILFHVVKLHENPIRDLVVKRLMNEIDRFIILLNLYIKLLSFNAWISNHNPQILIWLFCVPFLLIDIIRAEDESFHSIEYQVSSFLIFVFRCLNLLVDFDCDTWD